MVDSESEKLRQLKLLGAKRRRSIPEGYRDVGFYQNGIYQSEFVSPYTKGSCNMASDIFVLLQDWVSDKILSGEVCGDASRIGRIPHLPTNRNLDDLLKQFFHKRIEDVFSTNLFPYVKSGSMSATIPQRLLIDAAQEFAVPQIEILRPKLVIAFGLVAFNAMRTIVGLEKSKNLSNAIDASFEFAGARVWCQSHPGALGRNNRNKGGVDRVAEDWQAMKIWYES